MKIPEEQNSEAIQARLEEEMRFKYLMEIIGDFLEIREYTRPLTLDIALRLHYSKFRV